MVFRVRVAEVSRVDKTVNVAVEYTDDVTGFGEKRVYNFGNTDWLAVKAAIEADGLALKNAVRDEASLRSRIGTDWVIN